MKKVMLFMLMLFLTVFVSCKKEKDEPKDLSANDAKVELRNVGQQVTTDMSAVMSHQSFTAMSFLMELLDGENAKQTVKSLMVQPGSLSLTKIKTAFKPIHKNSKEEGDFGVFVYNFTTGEFDLTEASTTKLVYKFPADETALANNQNNAVFTATDLQYQTVTYEEEEWDDETGLWVINTYEELVPTKANLDFKISGTAVMTAQYNASYNANGFPQSMSANVTANPYTFSMTMGGSSDNYTTTMSFKQGSTEITGYNLTVKYTSDLEDVEKVSGNYAVSPLNVDGWMNYAAINTSLEEGEENGGIFNLDYLNTQISMALIHTGLNAKIGDLMFKMYTDPEDGEKYPTLAIVYSDGTYEWFDDIMGSKSLKFTRNR